MGIHQVIVDSINRADLDLRKSLYSNVVLSGGSTLCRGFGERLLSEVKKLALKDIKIKIYAPPERKYSTWIGGSILASLSTFKKVTFTFLLHRLVKVIGDHWHLNLFVIDVGLGWGIFWRSRYYTQENFLKNRSPRRPIWRIGIGYFTLGSPVLCRRYTTLFFFYFHLLFCNCRLSCCHSMSFFSFSVSLSVSLNF